MDKLNEVAARWLGLEYKFDINGRLYIPKLAARWYFDPLHSWDDLMLKVVPRLPKNIRIIIGKGEFIIGKIPKGMTRGSYPADFPTAVLELVKELEGGEE